jgi:hypothetical protein
MVEICRDMALQAKMLSAFISPLLSARAITSTEAAATALPAKELESANAADDRRCETLAAMMLAAEDNDRRRHEVVLAAEDDDQRRHEAVLAAGGGGRRPTSS